MDPQLRATLAETAYYASVSSVSTSGDPVYGAATAFVCRTELDRYFHGPLFMPRQGEEEETNVVIYTEVDVPDDALIWLPGVSTASATGGRRPKRREVARGPTGAISHYEIYL
jgi:hypothetical protein